jgi:hypothetical protein
MGFWVLEWGMGDDEVDAQHLRHPFDDDAKREKVEKFD